jgi:ATP-binding cassette subfamily F protein 3
MSGEPKDRRAYDYRLFFNDKERSINMIKFDNFSYAFPQKDLYDKISFTLDEGQHCAFIGTSGSGKSTLVDILMDPEHYMFDGTLEMDPHCRIGYVSQFSQLDGAKETTVFEYIAEAFLKLQSEIASIGMEMETAQDIDPLLEKYQTALDAFEALGGDNFESNINKKLNLANLFKLKDQAVSALSGGEFKLIQVIREMLNSPDLLIMDEPDVFLDFENLNALKDLINSHKGILLVITHNRYLLNHCFDKVIHLENKELQEFDGSYIDYNFSLLQKKIELQELATADTEEIARYDEIIRQLRYIATNNTEASRGKALMARVRNQERLEARRIKAPFVEIKQPAIHFEAVPKVKKAHVSVDITPADMSVDVVTPIEAQMESHVTASTVEGHADAHANQIADTHVISPLLKVDAYSVAFDEMLLENVSFEIGPRDKVAIIGSNGTGKTTLLRAIYKNDNPAIQLDEHAKVGYLSQLQGESLEESNTILDEFFEVGFNSTSSIKSYLMGYGFDETIVEQKIGSLSGGEKNILQIAKIASMQTNMLLLDEPTSHLDTYSQIALEKAIDAYKGAILMISHDYYTIVNSMDYVLIIENKTVKKMSMRKFRKMIYDCHFDKDYLEREQKKKQLETRIELALKENDFELAKVICEELEALVLTL